jgi:hypothetical protein
MVAAPFSIGLLRERGACQHPAALVSVKIADTLEAFVTQM